MADIKRILWVDDYPNNMASDMFPDVETRQVSTMEEAIMEISGKHLYDYDTIVLDIDFENGLPKGEKQVLKKLNEKIYLNKDQKNKNFIINNGGYLLFLYLLEKGYPSEQVAFLTGNAGIIGQLKTYTRQNQAELSKEEITDAFIKAWENSDDDIDLFQEQIDALPIDVKYKDSDFVFDCAEAIDVGDTDEAKRLIEAVTPTMITGSIQNTGDMMIFRFHEANLESPVYFSKNDNDIDGHNREDAEKWLVARRTYNNVTRWLLLDAADYVEKLFKANQELMSFQVGDIFRDTDVDPGIRLSFRQLFFAMDGLRNTERRGIYYQAVSAMLIPFDSAPKTSDMQMGHGNNYDMVRRMFARVSKQARNYCAHNSFGSSLSNRAVLFILSCTMLAVISRDQARDKANWFEIVYDIISERNSYVVSDNNAKIDELCRKLLEEDRLDTYKAGTGSNYDSFDARDMLNALGYNKDMSVSEQQSTGIRERYFMFTLAAYVVKWFEGLTGSEVKKQYGRSVAMVYRLSNEIVVAYEYPL